MANSFDSRTIYIDDFSSDIDVGDSAFGLTEAPFFIAQLIFDNPTTADVVVLKNARGEVVTQIRASVTGEPVGLQLPMRSEGLKLLAADQTVTTGSLLIHLQ